MRPKISVIIPVYGVEKYIERCAVSLFEQTMDDIEYLFINDCTKDNSISILKQVLERYPNRKEQTKIIDMPQNSGQAAVRKYGIELATGEYIIHCDSDDWVDTNMYKSMYECAITHDVDITICDYYLAKSTTDYQQVAQCIPNKKEDVINGLIRDQIHGSLCNKLVKSNLYKNLPYFPKDNLTEDLTICVQLFYAGKSFYTLNNSYYFYYQNDSSIINKRIDDKHTLELAKQIYRNYIIIERFIREKRDYMYFEKSLTCRKVKVKLGLRNMCLAPGGTKEWHKVFPEIKIYSIFKYNLNYKAIISYIITYVGMYRFFKLIKSQI